jgi:hypothetical protein
MTSGRLIAIAIIAITAAFAAALWYAQTRAYFEPLAAAELTVTTASGESLILAHSGFEGIDAASSPLRFRGCFQLDTAGLALVAQAQPHPDPTPLVAPDWFSCFDAGALTADLATGAAMAVLSVHEVHRGIDRVIAAYPDGRAFAWHQLNGTLEQ